MANSVIKVSSLADVQKELIELPGTYGYWHRIPSIDSTRFDIKKAELQGFADKTGLLKYFNQQVITELEDYNALDIKPSEEERYLTDYGCEYLRSDRFSALEQLGAMRYSKGYTLIYSLYDKLDYALAYIFNTPLETIRENLLANCKEYNIDYIKLSYAFCCKSKELLNTIDLRCLINISPNLDAKLLDLAEATSPYKISLGDQAVNLSAISMSLEERITAFLLAKVGYFMHLVINSILQQFKDGTKGFACNSTVIPVSVGRYCIVAAATEFVLTDLTIEIEDLFSMVVPVGTYKSIGVLHEDYWYNKFK